MDYYLSDIGNNRTLNEDYIACYEDSNFKIFVIADGMGGYNAGEIASKVSAETVISYFKDNYNEIDLPKTLEESICIANEKVYELSKSNDSLKGMGTTITVAVIKNNELYVANIGDSSCFIIKNNEILKITKDHSFVQELIDIGTLKEEDAKNHPQKNVLTRALGISLEVKIDIFKPEFCKLDKVILCTDGLTNYVDKVEILNVVNLNNNREVCEELINLSKIRGGRDNISIIVCGGKE